jgi:hypothetical protein
VEVVRSRTVADGADDEEFEARVAIGPGESALPDGDVPSVLNGVVVGSGEQGFAEPVEVAIEPALRALVIQTSGSVHGASSALW